jgi:hypothetical protein
MHKLAARFAPRGAPVLAWLFVAVGSPALMPGLAAMPSAGGDLPLDERSWNFRVLLDDRDIGYHDFRVVSDGTTQEVWSDARFDVKILFFNAYRYRHSNTEVWRNGCLTEIRSSTDANGDRIEVAGNLGDTGFELLGAEGRQVVGDDCVRSFAYWNPTMLRHERLLNAQTGELMPVVVREYGPDQLQIGGLEIPAHRLQLTVEKGVIDLWYHRDTGRWLALEAPTEGGRTLRYESASPPGGTEVDERLAMD